MIDLRLGDSYEHIKTIADKSVDLIITDPPYVIPHCKGGQGERSIKVRNWQKMDGTDNLRDGFDFSILDEFYRIQPFLNLYIFCNCKLLQQLMAYYYEKGFTSCEVLIYHKTNPLPSFKGHYLLDMEYILYVCEDKSSLVIDFASGSKLFSMPLSYERHTEHPTEKPLSIVEQLIRNSSREGQVVYDPFSGGGTTAHACKALGRKFIGCELNEKFYNQSINRLSKVTPTLF